LQYQLVLLRHRFLSNRLARGKCYELRHLTTVEKTRVEQYLLRHVEVCEQIGVHSNIANNITAAPVAGLWWVLDRWEEGETLSQRLSDGPLGDYALRVVMTGIAVGLAALHSANIVRRELSPASVLLRESDDRPILTDMELAKLGEGAPTVSPDEWPDDPYRALEVGGDGPIDVRADIYSWARIFMHAATGTLAERGGEDLKALQVPQAVRDWVERSLSVTPSGRPATLKGIVKALKAWP
jgi:serine/threonine protein kinase